MWTEPEDSDTNVMTWFNRALCVTPHPHRACSSAAQREKWKMLYYLYSAAVAVLCVHTLLSNHCFHLKALCHADVTLRLRAV